MPVEDLVGQKFKRLMVLARGESTPGGGASWVCRCRCGACVTVPAVRLKLGKTGSCGCLRREKLSKKMKTHGQTRSPEYVAWIGMKKRCNNPATADAHRYKDRGITVSKRWLNSFENFFADMGLRPSPEHSLERKNNSLGYSKSNCVWATPTVQNNNRVSNAMVTHAGVTRTIAEWAVFLDRPSRRIQARLAKGWTVHDALFKDPDESRVPYKYRR